MALSALGEQREKFQRMLDQLNDVFMQGINLFSNDLKFNITTYLLCVNTRVEVWQAMNIIINSGLLSAPDVTAIASKLSKTSPRSLFDWDGFHSTDKNSLIEVSVYLDFDEDTNRPYFAIYIDKTF